MNFVLNVMLPSVFLFLYNIVFFDLVHRSSWLFKDCLISTKTFQPLKNIYETSWFKLRLVIWMNNIKHCNYSHLFSWTLPDNPNSIPLIIVTSTVTEVFICFFRNSDLKMSVICIWKNEKHSCLLRRRRNEKFNSPCQELLTLMTCQKKCKINIYY